MTQSAGYKKVDQKKKSWFEEKKRIKQRHVEKSRKLKRRYRP